MKAGHRSAVRRFDSAEIDPSASIGLALDHPAVVEGRTIFPTTVVGSLESPRFLVSGHNNPKLGKTVLKGPRTGWPIFHVTLEERATCPRSCHAWLTCYGSAMPYSRRHRPDSEFLPLLAAEVATVARANTDGLLVRLHALGDFYSTAYVETWVELLAKFPQLSVFGYTARREDADDAESRKIARMIRLVTAQAWERFSIRFSRAEAGPQRSIIVDEDPGLPDVIVCPAQTKQTEACATCGLCWAPSARDKTIAFLRHGMKRHTGPRIAPAPAPAPEPTPEPAEKTWRKGTRWSGFQSINDRTVAKLKPALPALFGAHPEGVKIADLMEACGENYQRTVVAVRQAESLGLGRWVFSREQRGGKVFIPPGRPVPKVDPVTETQALALGAILSLAKNDECAAGYREICALSGVARGSIVFVIDALVAKGLVRVVEKGHGAKPTRFQVLPAARDTPLPRPQTTPAPALPDRAPGPRIAEIKIEPRPAPTRQPRNVSRKLLGDPLCGAPAPVPTPEAEPVTAPIVLAEVEPLSGPRVLAKLRAGQCKWPIDDPGPGFIDRTLFCAEDCGESTYCARHEAMSLPGKSRAEARA